MTRKSLLVGILGILVFLSIVAGEVSAQAKTLVITGITGHSGNVMALLASNSGDLTGSMVAVAEVSIANNRLSFSLLNAANESQRWTGSGEYYIVLVFEESGNAVYYYTQGGASAQKYNITAATTTIAYNQFRTSGATGAPSAQAKTLVVTGVTGHSGNVMAVLSSDSSNLGNSMVAVAQVPIANNRLSFQLLQAGNEAYPWTGSGEYYIVLVFEGSNNAMYYYSQGGTSAQRYNITDATTTIAYNQFRTNAPSASTSSTSDSNTYTITGRGTSFSAARGGSAVASGTIQTVIDAIRTAANGAAVTIRFGNGTDILDIGTERAEFNNTGGRWGLITLTGKITGSRNSGSPVCTILIADNISATSNADIASTGSMGWTAIRKEGTGTLTITGGTLTSRDTAAELTGGTNTETSVLNISGGTFTGRNTISNGNSGTVNISGGTIEGSYAAVYNYNRGNTVNISGGTISGTGAGGCAIYNLQDGFINLSGNAVVTSANTNPVNAGNVSPYNVGTIRLSTARPNNVTVLTVGPNVTLTNTARGLVVFNPNNAVMSGWPR